MTLTLKEQSQSTLHARGLELLKLFAEVNNQGCYSEFGSNKVRKKVKQGKEKKTAGKDFKIFRESA